MAHGRLESVMMSKKRSTQRSFNQLWLFEPATNHSSYLSKRMFGGLAIYLHGKMMAVLAEDPNDHTWQGVTYPHPIWNGILFPVSREDHALLRKRWQSLVPHPVLGKWLYLPLNADDYESTAQAIVLEIVASKAPWGIEPRQRTARSKPARKSGISAR